MTHASTPTIDRSPLATDAVLSRAETRIVCGYVDGLIGKEIADACGIAYRTVVAHTQNIYEKADIRHSTNALVAWFLSVNCGIDLSEFRRRVTAAFLFAIVTVQTVCPDFDHSPVRRFPSRRVEVRGARRSRRDEGGDSDTFYF